MDHNPILHCFGTLDHAWGAAGLEGFYCTRCLYKIVGETGRVRFVTAYSQAHS